MSTYPVAYLGTIAIGGVYRLAMDLETPEFYFDVRPVAKGCWNQ